MGPVKWLMFPTSGELETPRKAAFVVVFQHFCFWSQMESRRVDVNANEKKESICMFGYLKKVQFFVNKEVWSWNWLCDHGLSRALKNLDWFGKWQNNNNNKEKKRKGYSLFQGANLLFVDWSRIVVSWDRQ